MGFQQNQLTKFNLTLDKDSVNSLAQGCEEYRSILIMYIDYRIEKLSKPMADFDKVNYGLERAWRDGEVANLIKLKEIIS